MVTHTCNANVWKVDARKSQVQGQLEVHGTRLFLKNSKTMEQSSHLPEDRGSLSWCFQKLAGAARPGHGPCTTIHYHNPQLSCHQRAVWSQLLFCEQKGGFPEPWHRKKIIIIKTHCYKCTESNLQRQKMSLLLLRLQAAWRRTWFSSFWQSPVALSDWFSVHCVANRKIGNYPFETTEDAT